MAGLGGGILARFAAALDDPAHVRLAGAGGAPTALRTSCATGEPGPDGSLKSLPYYGCGWQVRPSGRDGRANYWHNGSLPGTFTRCWCGATTAWAGQCLFNQRSSDLNCLTLQIDGAVA